MINFLSKLSNAEAVKELKLFLIIGYVCTVVSLVAFGFLSMVGVAVSIRCLVLLTHSGNKQQPKFKQLQIAAITLAVLSTLLFIVYILS